MAVTQRPPTAAPKALHRSVEAKLEYGCRPSNNASFFNYIGEVPEGKARNNTSTATHDLTVEDLRAASSPATLRQHGFQFEFLEPPTSVEWSDDNQIKTKLYPAVEDVLKRATGASKVITFDHTLRKGSIRAEADKPLGLNRRAPVPRPHCDYTSFSGQNRLKQLYPDEADELQQSPYAVIQVYKWRLATEGCYSYITIAAMEICAPPVAWLPLRGPVKDSPLALCDASSVSEDDVQPVELIFPDRVGHTYLITHNPQHRWYYASDMQTNEMYVWFGYDSRPGRKWIVPHTAFHDPDTPADALERESIELRAYVFWENDKDAHSSSAA